MVAHKNIKMNQVIINTGHSIQYHIYMIFPNGQIVYGYTLWSIEPQKMPPKNSFLTKDELLNGLPKIIESFKGKRLSGAKVFCKEALGIEQNE